MTDRSYLPYQSARDFQDRGMAKWAGFFLSEHSTALAKKELDISRLIDRKNSTYSTKPTASKFPSESPFLIRKS